MALYVRLNLLYTAGKLRGILRQPEQDGKKGRVTRALAIPTDTAASRTTTSASHEPAALELAGHLTLPGFPLSPPLSSAASPSSVTSQSLPVTS